MAAIASDVKLDPSMRIARQGDHDRTGWRTPTDAPVRQRFDRLKVRSPRSKNCSFLVFRKPR
ncbi:hypothetical protein GR240_33610 [Rhizobium leguminosarum]|nr:hypothetical protein [Rhizobium ruizarguesonis]